MQIIYKYPSLIETIDKIIAEAELNHKEIEKIILTKEEWEKFKHHVIIDLNNEMKYYRGVHFIRGKNG